MEITEKVSFISIVFSFICILYASSINPIEIQDQLKTMNPDNGINGGAGGRIGVIFNGNSTLQTKLYKASWMGFRDALPDSQPPHIINTAANEYRNDTEVAKWLLTNQTYKLVSLLDSDELVEILRKHQDIRTTYIEKSKLYKESQTPLHVVSPRDCVSSSKSLFVDHNLVEIECLQMNNEGFATALVHRMMHVGITKILPVFGGGDEKSLEEPEELFKKYKQLFKKYDHEKYKEKQGRPLKILNPVYDLFQLKEKLDWLCSKSTGNKNNNGSIERIGILILGRGSFILSETIHMAQTLCYLVPHYQYELRQVYTFSPWGVQSLDSDSNMGIISRGTFENGHYTLMYVRSGIEWNNPSRRRLLSQLNDIIGPNPLILTAVLAYEGAVRISDNELQQLNHRSPPSYGTFFGISPKPTNAIANVMGVLLQKSDYILEDIITLKSLKNNYDYHVINYKLATSSILTRHELVTTAAAVETKLNCSQHRLLVTNYDPFTQLPSTYEFSFDSEPKSPHFLLIPNQYGYGIELSCIHNQEGSSQNNQTTISSLNIACIPPAITSNLVKNKIDSIHDVECFRSNHIKRVRRASSFLQPRDDTNSYYQAPPPSTHSNGGGYMPMSMSMMDMDEASMTTTEAAPTEPPPPPPPPPPKLPDLRAVLKAAKPFIGACIGASTGCAICVLVLGRLPLGAVPALCSGPCFTGTFGNCGGLLGRVASETTVICTELFKQGYIDVETFIADAEYGRLIENESPMTLKGYQFLARPLVSLMQSSPFVTNIVSKFAKPWAAHMKYLIGHEYSCNNNWFGEWLHLIGSSVCKAVGYLVTFIQNIKFINLVCTAIYPHMEILLISIIFICFLRIFIINRKFNPKLYIFYSIFIYYLTNWFKND